MSAGRTHFRRVAPPWRTALGHTMCGRRVADEPPRSAGWARSACVITPGAKTIAAARAAAQAGKIRDSQYRSGRTTDVPGDLCVACWERLALYGYPSWRENPLAVLRADLAVVDQAASLALGKELIALADLVAAHPGEFREFMEREAVLAALAG